MMNFFEIEYTQFKFAARALAAFMVFFLAACGRIGPDNREPAIVKYCSQVDVSSSGERKCIETKTLKIPAAYYGHVMSVPDVAFNDAHRIEAVYPSMKPWSSLSFWEQRHAQKIEIQLWGVTTQTVLESFSNYFLGPLKPIHRSTPVFDLDRYDDGGGMGMRLLPLEKNPKLHLFCGSINLIGDIDVRRDSRAICKGTTYTDWKLKLIYLQPQVLLPQWAEVHSKVNGLVESFVVTP